jgi:hypothetical protein
VARRLIEAGLLAGEGEAASRPACATARPTTATSSTVDLTATSPLAFARLAAG